MPLWRHFAWSCFLVGREVNTIGTRVPYDRNRFRKLIVCRIFVGQLQIVWGQPISSFLGTPQFNKDMLEVAELRRPQRRPGTRFCHCKSRLWNGWPAIRGFGSLLILCVKLILWKKRQTEKWFNWQGRKEQK